MTIQAPAASLACRVARGWWGTRIVCWHRREQSFMLAAPPEHDGATFLSYEPGSAPAWLAQMAARIVVANLGTRGGEAVSAAVREKEAELGRGDVGWIVKRFDGDGMDDSSEPSLLPAFAAYAWCTTPTGQRSVILLQEVHVAAGFQRAGIGRELVRAVERVGREHGACATVSFVHKANVNSLAFHDACGLDGVSELRSLS